MAQSQEIIKYHSRVRKQVSRAIKSGLIKKTPCVICGETSVEAHHDDYDKPLDVIFYCSSHHCMAHKRSMFVPEYHI